MAALGKTRGTRRDSRVELALEPGSSGGACARESRCRQLLVPCGGIHLIPSSSLLYSVHREPPTCITIGLDLRLCVEIVTRDLTRGRSANLLPRTWVKYRVKLYQDPLNQPELLIDSKSFAGNEEEAEYDIILLPLLSTLVFPAASNGQYRIDHERDVEPAGGQSLRFSSRRFLAAHG
ncbi:hypothetical protein CIRG_10273 [Coccidioides immitis RMSCC 2394]|uniref:Uncharacterized protein n=1 Tax=Coccidioides immitis RMSCC 2394 TaxID=404692 RepID=A0A0J6Y3Z1_COCIT|nr:hypothetical protein CIRG_10273 [Coccidioides immitis RMSCC 2394]